MSVASGVQRLDPPVNASKDHVLGPPDAPITLVEYGSYACPNCRAAHNRVIELRDQFGDRLVYGFRHRPIAGDPLAREAAELVELAAEKGKFWKAHVALMTRSALVAQPRSVRPSNQRAGRPIRAMFRASRWMFDSVPWRRPLPHSTASTTRSRVCRGFTLTQPAPRRPAS